jgi:hypothetical protein
MAKYRVIALTVTLLAAAVPVAEAQQPGVLPMGPARERGASITPAYEGWYQNDDGSFSMLIGYYNRNSKEPMTIPIGPNNRIEPGDPDQGQPTYFETGRQWGVFVIKVPKDFGNKVIKWTLTANGETQTVPFTLNPRYPITPYKELGMLNEPPTLTFKEDGPKIFGPPTGVAATLTAMVGQPMPISIWVSDVKERDKENAPTVANVSFHKYRGPGDVKFESVRIAAKQQGGMITGNATFSAPGEYTLRVQANDESGEGGGGFQCCWTNTYVKVTVK